MNKKFVYQPKKRTVFLYTALYFCIPYRVLGWILSKIG